jgi:Gluconate 2-dehydrogenase subunit 3
MTDNPNMQREMKLKRRDMLKAMTAVPTAVLVQMGSATAAESPSSKSAAGTASVAGYHRKALSEHEFETIKVLSDLIIPADERSGSASQAGVPEFIDDWLDFKGDVLKADIRGGLTWLDMECNQQFGKDFVSCALDEQKKILDRVADPDKASLEDSSYVVFFGHLRDLVVGGFFSSEMGVEDLPYLGNKMVADWEGCPSNVLMKIEDKLKAQGRGLSLQAPKET